MTSTDRINRSHSIIFISNCLRSSFKVRALASLDCRDATTLQPEQPKPAQPIMTMISPILQFVVELDRVGFAQIGTSLNS